MQRIKLVFLPLAVILLAGCATWGRAGGPYSNGSAKYEVDLPWGWMKLGGKDLMLTRDGLFLDKIAIQRKDIDKKLEHTKKKFIKGMLPEELSEVAIDDIAGDSDISGLEIIENIPASLSGQLSFRLIYTFRNKDSLKYKCIYYGFGYEEWVYSISYTAAADYYFDKNVEEFNRLVKSFRFLPGKGKEKTDIPDIPTAKEEVKRVEPASETSEIQEVVTQEDILPALDAQPKFTNYSEYYRFLYKKISAAAIKPEGSPGGTVNISLTLLADGTVDNFEIMSGSTEDASLRSAAEKAVKNSEPFPPFPDDIKEEGKKTFTVTMEFRRR